MSRFVLPALAVLSAAAPASGQAAVPVLPRVARLEYVLDAGAKSCPGEKIFRTSVGGQVDHPVFAPEASARLRVVLSRHPKDGRYAAALDLYDGAGGAILRRAITPLSRCSDTVQAAAVVVAEMLDPIQPEPEPPRALSPPSPPVLEAPPAPAPKSDRLTFRAGLDTRLGLGVAPRPAVGLAGDVGLRWSPISVSAELRWDPPASAGIGSGAQLSTWRLLGGLVPCGHWSKERWGLFGCAVVQAGKIWGKAESMAGSASVGEPSVAAGGRAGVELRLDPITPHLGLRLFGDLMATVQGGAFVIRDQVEWRTPRVAGGVGLGVVASW